MPELLAARARWTLLLSGPAILVGTAGGALLATFLAVAALAPVIAPHDPWRRFEAYLPPGPEHWLGTNDLGNDILSELLYGARVSLLAGLGTSGIATALGLAVGLLSGYFRGAADELLMGLTDVILMIPAIPTVIILAAFLRPGYGVIVLVLGLLWWTSTARVVRSKVLHVREQRFVTAQRTLGFSHLRIMISDVLPNILHVLAPKFMLTVASAMIAEASLSFLGLGDPAVKSWGMMNRFAFGRGGFIRELWWWYTAPGLAITLCVLSLALIGETGIVFQNPSLALNPIQRIGRQIGEPLVVHRGVSLRSTRGAVVSRLRRLGFRDIEAHLNAYPFQFSGGMNQRAIIAASMILDPRVLIADEPTKGLDAGLRGLVRQEMVTIKSLQGSSLLLITHELELAREIADTVVVLYGGQIVEIGPAGEVFRDPLHPCTRALLRSLPENGFHPIPGPPLSLIAPPPGCRFHPRCPIVTAQCARRPPELRPSGGRFARCLLCC